MAMIEFTLGSYGAAKKRILKAKRKAGRNLAQLLDYIRLTSIGFDCTLDSRCGMVWAS
jgi:hypothetical protein